MPAVTRPHRLLFVCSGNLCRSPMAEVLARAYAEEHDIAVEVDSAGTLGIVDRPAEPKAISVCAERGVDLTQHRSKGLSASLVTWADWVLVMEMTHAGFVRDEHPEVGERLLMLGTFGGNLEIADPIGGWTFRFRRTRNEIDHCVRQFLDRLPPRGIIVRDQSV